jgi:hypothetical protein
MQGFGIRYFGISVGILSSRGYFPSRNPGAGHRHLFPQIISLEFVRASSNISGVMKKILHVIGRPENLSRISKPFKVSGHALYRILTEDSHKADVGFDLVYESSGTL